MTTTHRAGLSCVKMPGRPHSILLHSRSDGLCHGTLLRCASIDQCGSGLVTGPSSPCDALRKEAADAAAGEWACKKQTNHLHASRERLVQQSATLEAAATPNMRAYVVPSIRDVADFFLLFFFFFPPLCSHVLFLHRMAYMYLPMELQRGRQ
ncbi:hypothetical protein BD289DRAFT_186307 [Coniella lustricola]|uniref:Uncharacterized protein n=1 Tax=Coniella lustricola TaxID=2025994 RepID=A0A2T3AD07_9PEZI|nr:hypothetical protein BD289DRAFT_186307 [Coniella lustricola]